MAKEREGGKDNGKEGRRTEGRKEGRKEGKYVKYTFNLLTDLYEYIDIFIAKLLPLFDLEGFYGSKYVFMSVCYHLENSVMSRILPGYRELDLKFRPFSHRNPVTCREAQAPLQELACEFSVVYLLRDTAESDMLRLQGRGDGVGFAVCRSPTSLATIAFLGEHPAKRWCSAEHTSGIVILYDLEACLHFLAFLLNSACDIFSFR